MAKCINKASLIECACTAVSVEQSFIQQMENLSIQDNHQ